MNKVFEKLQPFMDRDVALDTALVALNWDLETIAPKGGIEYTAKVMGILSGEQFSAIMNDEVKAIINELASQTDLTDKERIIQKHYKKQLESLEKVSKEEYQEYSELIANAGMIWQKAKNKNDYSLYEPYLAKIIEFQKRFAGYRAKKDQKLYDVLLDDFEEGFSIELLDQFFSEIRNEIVPLLKRVVAKKGMIDKSYCFLSYDIQKQEQFSKWIAQYLGFDFNRGVIAQSEHPFTSNLHNHDVRITTHYHKDHIENSIFSTIHETGHALYELGIADELTQTPAGMGISMGMHESQSRFYENIIGRSEAFWTPIYGKLLETFPEQLKDVDLQQFILGINMVEPGLIRTEADELTYSLHVMVRYEIEKMIFAGEVSTKELPKLWNQKYEEYLGIRPSNDTEGILQDMHWSGGAFGYFPSYSLGSAIGAQIYAYMKKNMDVDALLKQGKISEITAFLREHIHRHGKLKTTRELLENMMGEEFDAHYYVDYLKDKYERLYQI